MPGLAAGIGKPLKFSLVIGDDVIRIIGPQRGEHLDAVIDRPFCKAASEIGPFFKGKREHTGLFDRAPDPDIMARGRVKRCPTKAVIDKYAKPAPLIRQARSPRQAQAS